MDRQHLRDYFIRDLGWGWGYQQQIVFDFLCEAANEVKGGVVLDAGAGNQRYKPFFDESIYIAQEHPTAGQQNKGIQEFDILSDIRQIPLQDCSVDLILSTSSLEHMEFPESFFKEAFSVLKPGGSLYINVPFAYMEHETPYDFQRPTRYGLMRYYRNAGFEKESVLPTSSSIFSAQYLFGHAIREDSKKSGVGLWARLIQIIMIVLSRLLREVAMYLYDRGPMNDTTLPIGWVAKGYKHGNKISGKTYLSKDELIINIAQCDSSLVFKNGRIVPK